MRLENVNPMERKPIGVGDSKETFVHPHDEERVVSVLKEKEQLTPNALKASYYLTKIAHTLLPDHVPDIYQASENQPVEEGSRGRQSFDRERVAHTPGHVALQEARMSGHETNIQEKLEAEARDVLVKEMGREMNKVVDQLADMGLGFNIDENAGNFTRDESGNVQYLENFIPWQNDLAQPGILELSFDIDEIKRAIENIKDDAKRNQCESYLARLLALFEEESRTYREATTMQSSEYEPLVQELTRLFEAFESVHDLNVLLAITTKQEALASPERKQAKADFIPLFEQVKKIQGDIPQEQLSEFLKRCNTISRAIGVIYTKSDLLDHNQS